MKNLITKTACAAVVLSGFAAGAALADDAVPGLQNRTIGFVLTSANWGLYQTPDGKAECPDGFNEGPREQFKALYPNLGTVEGTQLERESASRYPLDKTDSFPYREVKGKIGIGLNLDGKVGPHDFTSADGEQGIDNELYRAIGCTRLFRGPDGTYANFTDLWVREMNFNRVLVELTNVDSLTNDPSVDVAIYRGKDKLMTDATGANIMPGGSNRVDERFGKRFMAHTKGKIENGVLKTEAVDVHWPWAVFLGRPGAYDFKGMKFQLALTGEKAQGLLGGYSDIDTWYQQLVRSWSTHHSSYGGLSQPSFYRALHRLADGYPGPDGKNMGISSVLNVKMVQIFIQHEGEQVAEAPKAEKPARDARH